MTIRVGITTDCSLALHATQALVDQHASLDAFGFRRLSSLTTYLAESRLDLVVLFYDPIKHPVETYNELQHLVEHHGDVPVVVISSTEDARAISKLYDIGARAVLTHRSEPEEFYDTIQKSVTGELHDPPTPDSPDGSESQCAAWVRDRLTRREVEVLRLVSEGMTTRQIASTLYISESTVNAHRIHIMDKLGVRSVAELTRMAILLGVTTI